MSNERARDMLLLLSFAGVIELNRSHGEGQMECIFSSMRLIGYKMVFSNKDFHYAYMFNSSYTYTYGME